MELCSIRFRTIMVYSTSFIVYILNETVAQDEVSVGCLSRKASSGLDDETVENWI